MFHENIGRGWAINSTNSSSFFSEPHFKSLCHLRPLWIELFSTCLLVSSFWYQYAILFKKNDVFPFFYIFFSKSPILWIIVANINKENYTSEIHYIFTYRKKKQVYWVIMWLCRSIFFAWKNMVNFCMAIFYRIFW